MPRKAGALTRSQVARLLVAPALGVAAAYGCAWLLLMPVAPPETLWMEGTTFHRRPGGERFRFTHHRPVPDRSEEHAYRQLLHYLPNRVFMYSDAWDFVSKDTELQTTLRRLPWLGSAGKRTWRFAWTGEFVETPDRREWYVFARQ